MSLIMEWNILIFVANTLHIVNEPDSHLVPAVLCCFNKLNTVTFNLCPWRLHAL